MKITVFDPKTMGPTEIEIPGDLSYFCPKCGASVDHNLELNQQKELVVNCGNCGEFDVPPVEKTREEIKEKFIEQNAQQEINNMFSPVDDPPW